MADETDDFSLDEDSDNGSKCDASCNHSESRNLSSIDDPIHGITFGVNLVKNYIMPTAVMKSMKEQGHRQKIEQTVVTMAIT